MLIRGARVIDPASGLDAVRDIRIEEGRIAGIGSLAALPGEEILEAAGLVAAPGLVDGHVHFRDPGQTWKEDITTGAAAAAAGGFTTVICMGNTVPSVDSVEVLGDLQQRAMELPIHVLNAANVTKSMKGEELTDLEALAAAGAVAFTDDGIPIKDGRLLLAAMERAAALGLPISLHEEDPQFIDSAGVNKGAVSEALGIGGAMALAEQVLTARDCLLSLTSGCRIDIQHVSSGRTVEVIRAMKKLGAPVFAEVTPQHFTLTEEAVLTKGALAKVNPPLRTEADRLGLIEGLQDGTIDMIVTDHAPHADFEKEKGIAAAPSGMIGLETSLALGITSLVETGALTLMELLEKMTIAPARFYGLDCGRLTVGGPADLVLFAPKERWVVTKECFRSRSANSPFIGMELTGRVKHTICGGKIV